jgi:hypothetical protein
MGSFQMDLVQMRLAVFVAIFVAFAASAFAISPEDAYRAVRQRAIKRLECPRIPRPKARCKNA